MPRFRKVYVNSSHRTSGTPTNFHYQTALDIDCTGEEKCHMAVTSVSLPNVFFSIQTNSNSKLYLYQKHPTTESLSVNSIVTWSAGNYSSTTLNQFLQQQLLWEAQVIHVTIMRSPKNFLLHKRMEAVSQFMMILLLKHLAEKIHKAVVFMVFCL